MRHRSLGQHERQEIEQVREALKYVLNNLREGDLFNVIAYDDQIESFRPELQRYNEQTRQAALGFVEGVYAGGTTNIDGALRTAFAQLQDPHQPTYIVFLTDGLPTAGETNEQAIVVNAKRENQVHARIFVFGVGYDVNGRFLDKLARENFGQSDYVRPNEDIEARVSSLYRRIESPAMTGVSMKFAFDELRVEEGAAVNRVYPKESFDLFAGEQLVVVGRYKKAGAAKVVVRGSVGGEERKFDFPASFVEKSNDETNSFVERLWAVRRIGEILDQLDLNGRNEELVTELVGLSKRHGILTPYTSFMADDGADQRPMAWNVGEASRRLRNLGDTSGVSGVEQRAFKGAAKHAAAGARPVAAAIARCIRQERDRRRHGRTGLRRQRHPGRRPSACRCSRKPRPRSGTSATSATAPSSAATASGSTRDSPRSSSPTRSGSSSSAASISTLPRAPGGRCRNTWPSTSRPWSASTARRT